MNVELIDFMGSDTKIANVARVSYEKEAANFSVDQNDNLLEFLWEESHTSPFRHAQLQFRVKCPIYVERQLRKHEIGIEVNYPLENMSINSISGRYVDFSDSYYFIDEFREQSKDSKQGSGANPSKENNDIAIKIQNYAINECRDAYDKFLDLNISKEQARSILPLALETTFIWTLSFLAFMHLAKLRLKNDAQKETRDVVRDMLKAVKEIDNNPFRKSIELLERKSEIFIVIDNESDIKGVFSSIKKLKKEYLKKGWLFDKNSLSLQNNLKTLFIVNKELNEIL